MQCSKMGAVFAFACLCLSLSLRGNAQAGTWSLGPSTITSYTAPSGGAVILSDHQFTVSMQQTGSGDITQPKVTALAEGTFSTPSVYSMPNSPHRPSYNVQGSGNLQGTANIADFAQSHTDCNELGFNLSQDTTNNGQIMNGNATYYYDVYPII